MRSLIQDVLAASQGQKPGDPLKAVRDSVVAHVRGLLATPPGTVLLAPDDGLEDSTHAFHAYPNSVGDTERALVKLLARFEPRLGNVAVTHVATQDLRLHFDIQGTLLSEGRPVPIHFSAVFDGHNGIALR